MIYAALVFAGLDIVMGIWLYREYRRRERLARSLAWWQHHSTVRR